MAASQGPFYAEFGRKLAAARRAAKVTQEALAKSVGLSRTSIVNIEKGRQPAHLHLVCKIAKSLAVNASALVPDVALLAPPALVPDLKNVAKKQNWPFVERIISAAAFKKGIEDATQILAGEAQGSGTASSGKSQKGASPDRATGSHRRRKNPV